MPEADVLDLGSQPAEAHEGDLEADEEELEESIEAAEQHKRLLAERNASLQNKVHQVGPPNAATVTVKHLFELGVWVQGARA